MQASTLHFITKDNRLKGEKNLLFSVYRDANVWTKAEVEDPAKKEGRNVTFVGSAFYM